MKKWLAILSLVSVAQAGNLSQLELVPFATGLSSPVALRHAGDGSGRLFVVQQDGVIRVIDALGTLLAEPLLDLSVESGLALTNGFREQGLLGLDFHPDFANNGYFYVNYTDSVNTDTADNTVVQRFSISDTNSNVADPDSGQVVIRISQFRNNHNGGDIHFGPDGFLYIGMGDGGGGGDPQDNAQDESNLLGKMVRIDVDNPGQNIALADACGDDSGGPVNYGIPASNPFIGADGTCDEIWALGLRNPYRFSFDRDTGDLFIGDVGQNLWEEVSFQPAGSSGGENYGWDCREGAHDYDGNASPRAPVCTGMNPPLVIEPIMEYFHDSGRRSLTGGYRYRGTLADGAGLYFFADFGSGEIFTGSETSPGVWTSSAVPRPYDDVNGDSVNLSPSAFGEDEEGELYVVDYNGSVYRLGDGVPTLVFRDGFE